MLTTDKLQWLVKNGFELTRKNWIEANWIFEGKTKDDLQAEELADIPLHGTQGFLMPSISPAP